MHDAFQKWCENEAIPRYYYMCYYYNSFLKRRLGWLMWLQTYKHYFHIFENILRTFSEWLNYGELCWIKYKKLGQYWWTYQSLRLPKSYPTLKRLQAYGLLLKKYSFIESKITNRQKKAEIVERFSKYQTIITEGLSFSTFSVTLYFSLTANQPYVATSMIICTCNL